MKLNKLTGTHAGRIVLAAVPVAVVATVLMGGVANGAVPVSFAVSGSQFQIGASQLDGTSFSQYAGLATDTAGVQHQVAIANIGQASLTDLCQSVVMPFAAGATASFGSTLGSTWLIRQVERDRSLLPYAAYRLALAAVVLRRLRAGS